MRSRGRTWGRTIVACVAAVAVTAGLVTASAAAPVGYSTTPLQGWSTNGTVWEVLVVGDTVYAGGLFTQVRSATGQTLARGNIAAFDLRTGAIRTEFTANANAAVRALAYEDGRLFMGGAFTNIGGTNRQRLAAVDATTGALVTGWTAHANSTVHAVAVNGGRLYAGGAFTTIGTVARNRIAAVSAATGAVDPTFDPDANNEIRALVTAPDGSRVYAGGVFTAIGGATRSFLGALSPTTGALLPLAFQRGEAGRVFDLDISPSGNQLFAALGDLENRAIAWNTTTGARQWQQIAMGDVQAISYYQGNAYFSFHEGFQNDTSVRVLAADAVTGALAPNFRPPINTFYAVWGIDGAAAGLVVGGEFTSAGGRPQQGVAIFPFGPADAVPPSPPAGLAVSATTATSITLSWGAGTDNVGVAGYRVVRDGVEIAYPAGSPFTDTDLPPASDHSYTVQTLDTSGNLSAPSPTVNAGTDQTLVAPRSVWRYLDDGSNQGTAWRAPGFADGGWASGPGQLGYGDGDEATVVSFGPNAAQKHVTTYFRREFTVANPAALSAVTIRLMRDDGAVVYLNGTEVARTNMPAGAITSTTFANVTVDGAAESAYVPFSVNPALLNAGTNTLAVEIHQRDRSSSDISFDLSLETARSLAPAGPTGLHATTVTGTSVGLAWTPPAGAVSSYRVYRDGVLVGSPSAPSFSDTGLTSATTYSYTVRALAGALESGPSAPLAVTTTDVVAPSTPTGLAAPTVAGNVVGLTWNASIDNVGVTGYDVLRGGTVVGTSTGTAFSDTTVTPNTAYSYTVRARDAAGNVSDPSASLPVTTPEATADVTPPSTPGNLRTTARGATSATIAWDPSTDDTGVATYIVTRNGAQVGTTAGTTFTDGLLTPGTTYTYRVVARDAALNASGPSAPLAVTTHAATETVFARNSAWRYTEDGIERGTAWKEVGYDDAAWRTGNGVLGYYNGNEATVLYDGGTVTADKFISHYLRRTFTVTDRQQITGLTLSVLRDDGVVVYVNGVEAFRNNMPTGPITSRTFANVALSGADEFAYVPFTIPASLLTDGTNTIAVSVHNNSRSGQSDLSFDAGLTATYG